jgi:thiosulfate/3-mercaptopyruvate sulfurtransferase
MCRIAALVLALLVLPAGGWANPEMLVETDWLARRGREPGVRIVDARSADAYAAGHVPGAVHLDADRLLRDPSDRDTHLPDASTFAGLMERAGIGNDTHVVVYGERGSRDATRLWYVLNVYGHERVSLVNGGWRKWAAEGRPTTRETPAVTRATFRVKETPALACPTPEVLARKEGVLFLDTRSAAEYAGTRTSGGATRTGHVPGAVHVDWTENVTGPHGVFKSAAELNRLYTSRGVTPDKEIVPYCATGGRASQTLFTLKLLGYPKVRLYYGSFSDYSSRPEAPVEK